MEVLKSMTVREVVNLIEWLKSKNLSSDDIIDCIETVGGKKNKEFINNINELPDFI